MAELIRVAQGTVVAVDVCPGCGGPIQWKPTRRGSMVHVYCTNNHTDAEYFGQRCGRRLLPGERQSQQLLARWKAGGENPLDLRQPQKETTDDEENTDPGTGDPADDTGDDEPGGILGSLFGG